MSDYFYKLRHKPTGKFFRTASGYSWEKTNFSPTGRVYNKRPSKDFLGSSVYLKGKETIPVILSDWEIVKYTIVEGGTEELK